MSFAAVLFALTAQQGSPLLSSVLPKPPAPEQVVMRVNGQPITAKEIEPYLWDWRGSEVTQDFVTYHLIQAEAKRAGVKVTVPEIQKAYDARLAQMRAGVNPGLDFDESLRAQGYPKSRLYLRVHADLLLEATAMKEFSPSGFVRVSTLAFKPASDSASDLATAIQRAQAAYDRLTGGADWNKEVQATDADTALKARNGHLGWRLMTAFPKSTQTELRTLKPGALTKPAQAADAIQVFRVEELGTSAKGTDLAELRNSFVDSRKQEIIQRLRSQAKVERLYPPK